MRENHPRKRGVVAWYLAVVAMLSLAACQIFPMPFGWMLVPYVTMLVLLMAAAVLGMTKKKPAGLFRIGWLSLFFSTSCAPSISFLPLRRLAPPYS
jgi:hypothetical protein